MSSNWIGLRAPAAERAFFRTVLLVAAWLALAPCAQAEPPRRATPVPSSTPADPPKPAPTAPPLDTSNAKGLDDAARSRARALYDLGAQAYAESRYQQAAEYFLDAHRIYPTPQLIFNVAKAYDRLMAQSGALAFYRDYLRSLPNAPDAAEIVSRIRELEAVLAQRGVQQLSILTDPPRALLAIDGMPVGITPWTGETWPGTHRVTLALDGHKHEATEITVDVLHAKDFSFALAPASAASHNSRGAPTTLTRSSSQVSALTWIVLGMGTAALGTTLGLEMAAGNNSGLTRTGAFFGGVGLTASVLGGLLLHLDLYEPEVTPTQKRHALAVSVAGRF